MPTAEEAVEQLSNLLAEYEPHITKTDDMGYGPYMDEPPTAQGSALTRLSAAIDRFAPPGSSYRQEAERVHASRKAADARAVHLYGIVRGLRDDYQAGYMRSVEELVHADLFSDFLDMAKELLDKHYKDPAAVLAGSVLEEHLRQLAAKAGVPVATPDGKPRNAEALNSDLGKRVYGTGEQKSVTAWLDLRNDAAHGRYDEYDHKQVALLIDSVRAFMARHPA